MFERILVPVDLTAKNVAAFERAVSLAAPGAEITLLHVVERIDVDDAELEGFYRRIEARARLGLERLAGGVDAGGRSVRREIVVGRRVDEIVAGVERLGCDLVVLASHRLERESAGPDWLTISFRVALLAPCAVLLVK